MNFQNVISKIGFVSIIWNSILKLKINNQLKSKMTNSEAYSCYLLHNGIIESYLR